MHESIKFYSRFESGNLLRAVKVSVKPDFSFTGMAVSRLVEPIVQEYDLYLRPDTFTNSHMHWFYFQMNPKNIVAGAKVRLNIRNLYRNKSLYQHGMLPRIRYLTGERACLGWHVDPVVTSEVRFFPTV